MLVLSHRGFHRDLPENTLEAFEAAIDLGVDGIETDLRLTADGALVLVHDRLTPDGRLTGEVTHAELCQLWGHDVPLAETALARWPQILWNLEIKAPAAMPAALELIARFQRSHRLLVTSFWHTLVEQVAQQTQADCGLLVSHRPGNADDARVFCPAPFTGGMPAWRRRINTIVWCYEFLDPAVIEVARQVGYRSICYSIATPAEHSAASAWGLDGIITDRPDFVVPGSFGVARSG